MKRVLLWALCSVVAISGAAYAKKSSPPTSTAKTQTSSLSNADLNFLALRDAVRNDSAARVAQLADLLSNYEISSYVDYYRLKSRLRVASEAEFRDFFQRYPNSAIGDRLRNDWLLDLGFKRQWALFDEQFPLFELNDDIQLKCYDLLSKSLKGQRVADDARALLISPKEYGEGCAALMASLVELKQFSEQDIWAQMRLALDTGATAQVRRIGALLGINARQLSAVIDSPAQTVAHGPGNTALERQLFILALGRNARTSGHALSAQALNRVAHKLSTSERAQAWAQIAYPAAQSLAPNAMEYWRNSEGAQLSQEAAQWRVRTALRVGDFSLVKTSIEAMPAELRADPTWIYWLARALMAEAGGNELPATAEKLLRSISEQRHFYGQLALEELGHKITAPVAAEKPSALEMTQASNNAGLKRAMKFFAMGLRFEGTRDWNWELRKMNDRQLLAAAELARRHDLLDRMVNTSDRTKAEFDFQQRFPAPHYEVMHSVSAKLELDKAWAYGLIRQESRFILNAKSSVGASGLMQLMPATAHWVANKIGLRSFESHQVNDIQTNITLGANYLNIVLKGLDNSQTLASAGYNAGPGRPKTWRASLPRAVEGAVFAETIPFLETRTYVKNVLSNATYYAALFDKKPQSLKSRLGTVTP